MIRVEDKNIFIWCAIIASALLLFSVSFGALFGAFGRITIAGPAFSELKITGALVNIQKMSDITPDQEQAIESAITEKMRSINWWLWWPFLNTLAWLITFVFLGLMKVVKFNECLVILTSFPHSYGAEKNGLLQTIS